MHLERVFVARNELCVSCVHCLWSRANTAGLARGIISRQLGRLAVMINKCDLKHVHVVSNTHKWTQLLVAGFIFPRTGHFNKMLIEFGSRELDWSRYLFYLQVFAFKVPLLCALNNVIFPYFKHFIILILLFKFRFSLLILPIILWIMLDLLQCWSEFAHGWVSVIFLKCMPFHYTGIRLSCPWADWPVWWCHLAICQQRGRTWGPRLPG